ncbi:MAG: flippase [Flavobacteriaceae bacterium]|nr:flippase [Flavobacteriaceae bacterium]
MAATFGVSILLGRLIGPSGLGIISLVNQIITILLVISILGMNSVVLKETAIAFERKDWQHVSDTVMTAISLNLPIGFIMTLMLIFITPWLSLNIFEEIDLKWPLIIALIAVVPQILSRILASSINGFRKIWQSNLVNETLSSIIVFCFLILIVISGYRISVILVSIVYSLSRVIVSIVMWIYWKKIFQFRLKPKLLIKEKLKISLPLFLVSSTNLVLNSADLLMLGWLSSSEEVGFYSVAVRLALVTSIFHTLSTSTITPKVASLFDQNKILELQMMVQKVTGALSLISLLSCFSFFIFGEFILTFWGEGFQKAFWPLIILSIGQFFNISTGATGVILIMCGQEKVAGFVSSVSVIINLTLNLVLIPFFGAIGAAITSMIVLIISNLLKTYLVYTKVGIRTFDLSSILRFK